MMKHKVTKWILFFLTTVLSLSVWGCGLSTGNEELDQAIVDMVVDGVNSYLEDGTSQEDSNLVDSEEAPSATEAPTPTNTPEPTATPKPTNTPKPTATPKPTNTPKPTATPKPTNTPKPTATPKPTNTPKPTATPTPEPAIDEDGWYYSKDDVALYIYTYGKLPENFITKDEARDLGWEGGSVERYKKGAAIGGDKFGNYEGLLPKKSGRKYYECDIDTKGKSSRGAKRIIFSNDGLIYYTDDHYESFKLLYGEE